MLHMATNHTQKHIFADISPSSFEFRRPVQVLQIGGHTEHIHKKSHSTRHIDGSVHDTQCGTAEWSVS